MPDSAEEPFAGFVARERDGLLRLAVLLEEDRADAEDLVRGVLVRARARWERLSRRGDPLPAARRWLVRRVLSRRPDDGPRTSGWVDDPYAGWSLGRHDDLRRALFGLPVATRAAVVLSFWAGLSDREVADLLRSPEDAVREEVLVGLTPLRTALAPVVPAWHAGGPRLPEDGELRDELSDLADDEVVPGDPDAAAADAEREVSSRRRRRWPVAIAIGAATAAVVVAVPVLQGGIEPSVPAADPPNRRVGWPADPDREGRATPSQVDISRLPTRGSLAGDADFLAGLLQQPWENEDTGDYPFDVSTAEDSRRVLYAGDVPAGRWALVAGRPDPVDPVREGIGGPYIEDGLYTAWFTGPPGAAPDDMRLGTFPQILEPGSSPALLDPPSGSLVVVGAPGDAIEVSERVEINADATDSRTWTPAQVDDGIAVADLDPVDLPWTWAVNYRIFRDDQLVSGSPDGVAPLDQQSALSGTAIDYPAGRPSAAGRRAAEWAAFIGLSSLGAPTADTDVTARVVEPVPQGEGAVALVTMTLPSGAYLVSAQWAWDIGEVYPGGADCGLDVRPADPPPAERLLVAVCEMYDPLDAEALGTLLVASTPPGVASLRLYRGDDSFLDEIPVDGDTVVAQIPAGTRTVEAVTAGGVLLGRSQPLGHWSPTTD